MRASRLLPRISKGSWLHEQRVLEVLIVLNFGFDSSDLTSWITYFLKAVVSTAKSAKNKFRNAVHLVDDYENQIIAFSGNAENNSRILKSFFNEPISTGKQIQSKTSLSQPKIDKAIQLMIDAGMLREITGYSRNRIYVLTKYLQVFTDAGTDVS